MILQQQTVRTQIIDIKGVLIQKQLTIQDFPGSPRVGFSLDIILHHATFQKVEILVQRNPLTQQRSKMVDLEFSDDGIRRIAEIAYEVNAVNENIGARRLYTIMETLLEELAFSADQLSGQKVVITPQYVDGRLSEVVKNQDLSQYIL